MAKVAVQPVTEDLVEIDIGYENMVSKSDIDKTTDGAQALET